MGLDFFARKKEKFPETIQAAALKYGEEIFLGGNHGQALDQLEEQYPNFDSKKVRDGFLTNTNRFVDRNEAAEIAEMNHQVKGSTHGLLDSSDIKEYR